MSQPVASTSVVPPPVPVPTQSDDEFPDVVWDFTSSDLERADPPPGGRHLSDSEEGEPNPVKSSSAASAGTANTLDFDSDTGCEDMSARTLLKKAARSPKPPMALREGRKNGFSVTDIVSTAWCELQVDYGLRQKRHKKPQERPKSFVTREGKTITVKQEVAVENSRRLERGAKVHVKLEREIHPIQVIVHATTKEEGWAKRLVSMMTAVVALKTMGACREMPVLGFVEDQLVFGVIDEIVRQHPAPKASKKSKAEADMTQSTLDAFISPSKPKTEPHAQPAQRLFLLDNKTRANGRLPDAKDSLSAKMQLMLYHRLLNGLLFPSAAPLPADLAAIWQGDGANPSLPFTKKFVKELQVLLASNGLPPVSSLAELLQLWHAELAELHDSTEGIDNKLEIVYRRRKRTQHERHVLKLDSSGTQTKRKRKIALQNQDDSDPSDASPRTRKRVSDHSGSRLSSDDDPELARAIELSLGTAASPDSDADLQLAIAASLQHQRMRPVEAHWQHTPFAESVPQSTIAADGVHTLAVDEPAPGIADDNEEILLHEVVIGATDGVKPFASLPRPFGAAPFGEEGFIAMPPEGPSAFSTNADPTTDTVTVDPGTTDSGRSDVRPVSNASAGVSTHSADTTSVGQLSTSLTDRPGPQQPGLDVDVMMNSDSEASTTDFEIYSSKKAGSLSRTFSDTAVIGIRRFGYDRVTLDRFLQRSLEYWRGKREPEGVAIEDVNRCLSCEYMDGCEWRAKKAEEFMAQATLRRQATVDNAA